VVSSVLVDTLLRAATRVGVDADAIAAALGLGRGVAECPDCLLSGEIEEAIWIEIVHRARRREVAVEMARVLSRGAFGGVEYLARSSDTFGGALANLFRFNRILHGRDVFALRGAAGRVSELRYDSPHWRNAEIAAYTAEFALGSVIVLGRDAIGREWFPSAVGFVHSAPSNDEAHRALFGDRIRFDDVADRLTFERPLLESPMREADRVLASILEGCLVRALEELSPGPGIADAVRQRIATALPDGAPSLEQVARSVGLSSRVLQRRLLDEGTSFARLLEDVRRALAQRYLSRPQLTMPAIALLLGYSDATALQRAFKRWTGMTPLDFRRSRSR
jgi:AraC-like DNA-binding protein